MAHGVHRARRRRCLERSRPASRDRGSHLDAWWLARESLYREIAPPLFMQREKPSNAQEGGRFQLVYFPGPVEVDWNVGPVSMATRPPTSRMLFARQDIPFSPAPSIDADERRERLQQATDFFWAMTPIAVKYAGRGATTDAVDQIELLARGLTESLAGVAWIGKCFSAESTRRARAGGYPAGDGPGDRSLAVSGGDRRIDVGDGSASAGAGGGRGVLAGIAGGAGRGDR